MKTALTLLLLVAGTILLALDRVLDKSAVIRLDQRLSVTADRLRPLSRKELTLATLWLVTAAAYYVAKRIGGPPPFALSFVLGLGALLFVISSIAVAAHTARKNLGDEPLPSRVLFVLLSPLLFAIALLAFVVHLALSPVIYPLKGVVFLNRRWFSSVSGLIGLVCLAVGTVLQFL